MREEVSEGGGEGGKRRCVCGGEGVARIGIEKFRGGGCRYQPKLNQTQCDRAGGVTFMSQVQ